MPRLDPSPYSDEPAPLRVCPLLPYRQRPTSPVSLTTPHLPALSAETLYRDPNLAPVPQSGEDYPPPKRTAILADVQAAHDVLAQHAKEHWHKTQGNGPREGEVVTGFLYACKVGGESTTRGKPRFNCRPTRRSLLFQIASSRSCRRHEDPLPNLSSRTSLPPHLHLRSPDNGAVDASVLRLLAQICSSLDCLVPRHRTTDLTTPNCFLQCTPVFSPFSMTCLQISASGAAPGKGKGGCSCRHS